MFFLSPLYLSWSRGLHLSIKKLEVQVPARTACMFNWTFSFIHGEFMGIVSSLHGCSQTVIWMGEHEVNVKHYEGQYRCLKSAIKEQSSYKRSSGGATGALKLVAGSSCCKKKRSLRTPAVLTLSNKKSPALRQTQYSSADPVSS